LQDFLYTAGDYVVLAYPNSIDNIEKIQNYTENVESRGAGTIFKKEFRYSFDNETFSEYFLYNCITHGIRDVNENFK
jgi:hypothetical protein